MRLAQGYSTFIPNPKPADISAKALEGISHEVLY